MKRVGTTFAGWSCLLLGAVWFLWAVVGYWLIPHPHDETRGAETTNNANAIACGIWAIIGLFWVPIGIGLFRRKSWARLFGLGYGWLWFLMMILFLKERVLTILQAVTWSWSGFMGWYLLRPSVKAQFVKVGKSSSRRTDG